jgi:hypothetical protein
VSSRPPQHHGRVRLDDPEGEALLEVEADRPGVVVAVADGEILTAVDDEVPASLL